MTTSTPTPAHRHGCSVAASLVAVALLGAVFFTEAPPARSADLAPSADYTGSGSCASSACHGSKDAQRAFGIGQNEFTTWSGPADHHSKAWQRLAGERSRLIQRNLGLDTPAQANPRCLDCHALNVPVERRARTFVLEDSVSCEACHGPAEQWLGPHTLDGWSHEQSLAAGMNDTRDLLGRARTCLGCHLGDERRQVDHELIAAGHPDLVFELDTFSATMPAHWSERSIGKDDARTSALRRWAVGQAVALEASMQLLARRSSDRAWQPDFADYDCFSCHHGLVAAEDSYRIRRGYAGAAAGKPGWNAARWAVLGELLALLDPTTKATIEQEVEQLRGALARGATGGADAAESARCIARAIEPVARRLADPTTRLDPDLDRRLLSAIARDAEPLAAQGYRVAEQVALAVDALHRPLPDDATTAGTDAVRRALDRLFEAVGDPNRFDPSSFAAKLRAVGDVLRLEDHGAR